MIGGGRPQIYIMSASGGTARHQLWGRELFDDRCGRRAAIHRVHQAKARADSRIGVWGLDGKGERIRTEGFHNEGRPSPQRAAS